MIHFVLLWVVLPTVYVVVFGLVLHYHPAFGEQIKGAFSDNAGKPSYTRMASFLAEIAVILWVTHIVWVKNEIPNLTNCVVLIASLFALDRLPEMFLAWKGIRTASTSVPTTSPGNQPQN